MLENYFQKVGLRTTGSTRRKVWKKKRKKILQGGGLPCADHHVVCGNENRGELYKTRHSSLAWTRPQAHAILVRGESFPACRETMIITVSHFRTCTTLMDRDKTPCVEKTRRTKCYRTWTWISAHGHRPPPRMQPTSAQCVTEKKLNGPCFILLIYLFLISLNIE